MIIPFPSDSYGLCKERKIPKIRDFYGSWWVGPGLSEFFFCGKPSKNCPKPVLIFWSSIPSVCINSMHC